MKNEDLQDANLRGVDLRDVDLRGVNLRDADLGGANLNGANLEGANLSGANLDGVSVTDANFADTKVATHRIDGLKNGGAVDLDSGSGESLIDPKTDAYGIAALFSLLAAVALWAWTDWLGGFGWMAVPAVWIVALAIRYVRNGLRQRGQPPEPHKGGWLGMLGLALVWAFFVPDLAAEFDAITLWTAFSWDAHPFSGADSLLYWFIWPYISLALFAHTLALESPIWLGFTIGLMAYAGYGVERRSGIYMLLVWFGGGAIAAIALIELGIIDQASGPMAALAALAGARLSFRITPRTVLETVLLAIVLAAMPSVLGGIDAGAPWEDLAPSLPAALENWEMVATGMAVGMALGFLFLAADRSRPEIGGLRRKAGAKTGNLG